MHVGGVTTPPCLLQGSTHTCIEPQHNINRVCHLADSGLLLMAVEDPKLLAYYVPVRDQGGCAGAWLMEWVWLAVSGRGSAVVLLFG